MSYLIYDDRPSANIPLGRLNPNRQWKTHLENWFFLKLTLMNGNMVERHQASKELAICERKLDYWERKAGFDKTQADKDLLEAKKRWQMEFTR